MGLNFQDIISLNWGANTTDLVYYNGKKNIFDLTRLPNNTTSVNQISYVSNNGYYYLRNLCITIKDNCPPQVDCQECCNRMNIFYGPNFVHVKIPFGLIPDFDLTSKLTCPNHIKVKIRSQNGTIFYRKTNSNDYIFLYSGETVEEVCYVIDGCESCTKCYQLNETEPVW